MKYSAYIVIALMALLAACTKTELCEEAEHPHKAGVQFAFDWSGVNSDARAAFHETEPGTQDSMLVIAKRIIGTRITGCRVDAKDGKGFYLFDGNIGDIILTPGGDSTTDGTDGTDTTDGSDGSDGTDGSDGSDATDDSDGSDGTDGSDGGSDATIPDGSPSGSPAASPSGSPAASGATRAASTLPAAPGYTVSTDQFRVQPGTFKFITVNFDKEEFLYDELYDYVGDGVTANTYLRDLCVRYKLYRFNSPLLHDYIPDWPDYNVYGPRDEYGMPTGEIYLQPDLMPVYYDSISPLIIDKNTTQTFTFRPSILTQNIDIFFDIKKITVDEEGNEFPFAIDTVCAEISGIPYRLNLSRDVFDIKNTGKMRFECWREDDNGQRLRNKDTEASTDLHYHANIDVFSIVNSADASAFRGPGILQLMIKIKGMKTIHARINLHETIAKAMLFNSTDDGLWAYRRKDHGVLKVKAVLPIDKDAVLPSEHSGLEIWTNAGDDDILVDT